MRKEWKNLSNQGCGRDACFLTLSEKSRPRESERKREGFSIKKDHEDLRRTVSSEKMGQ